MNSVPTKVAFQEAVRLHGAGRLREAEGLYRQILQRDPNNAEAMHHLGLVGHQVGQHAAALEMMRRSIAIKPNVSFFHKNLGAVLQAMAQFKEAAEAYERAIKLEPNDATGHHALGVVLEKLHEYERAKEAYGRAIQLDTRHAPSYFNLGVITEYHGEYEASLRMLEKAIELKPDYALARTSRATALLRLGRFENGWREYEWRWRLPQFKSDLPDPARPVWNGEALQGRTILLRCEQGLGDTIQFVRYATLVKERGAEKVILLAQAPVANLMKHAAGVDEVVAHGEPTPAYDVQVPLLSLPRIFDTKMTTIPAPVPYVTAEAERVAAWRDKLAPDAGMKVGLVWSSNPGHPLARFRTTTLSTFAPLAAVERVSFYSLQKGEPSIQAAAPPSGMKLVDRTAELADFADTAALIETLDLVITVDTAVAHLAGAMGKKTFTIVPFLSDFRWFLDRDDSPWYPTMRLFRLRSMYGWDEAVGRVKAALDELVRDRMV